MRRRHDMPFGARVLPVGVEFRLWAPSARSVALVVEGGQPVPMGRESSGWARLHDRNSGPGTLYRFLIDGHLLVPDPASRFQPHDVHGPSEVVDPHCFDWSDDAWAGRTWAETVIYELHVGTFTAEGTFRAAIGRLDYLVDLGVTAVEIMPVGDFPGRRNWGYDGVLLFAPDSAYGHPEDLKSLVQAAHQRGLMVFLDVVYNHFGPDGNYLSAYAAEFFTDKHRTPWGKANNFDDEGAQVSRAFYVHNALYWLEEFHFDGLRLDAVHAIIDDSERHFLVELSETIRAHVTDRPVHLVLENAANQARYLGRKNDRPTLFSAQWNDDIHHAFHVLLTGERGGYYADYAGAGAKHLGRCLAEGFAYQGEMSAHEGAVRGEPSSDLPATAFVCFLQNHDQIGNRAMGERIAALASAEAVRACHTVLLLAPQIPLLFMGEEWDAHQPFLFFCDFRADLADAVREGRRREFASFPAFRDEEARARIPDPNAADTFAKSRLRWSDLERDPGRAAHAWNRSLLRLRRAEIAPRLIGLVRGQGRAEVLGPHTIEADWVLGDGSRLFLQANLGDSVFPKDPADRGRMLVSTHADADGQLPAWFVQWSIEDAHPAEGEGR